MPRLGTTFVAAHIEEINVFAGNLLETKPWMLAVVLFFASMLLYSQAATTKALMPAALGLGVSPATAIASFAAVSAAPIGSKTTPINGCGKGAGAGGAGGGSVTA